MPDWEAAPPEPDLSQRPGLSRASKETREEVDLPGAPAVREKEGPGRRCLQPSRQERLPEVCPHQEGGEAAPITVTTVRQAAPGLCPSPSS